MPAPPDVSVIIPTHRREDLLLLAVSSALRQERVRVQVVVLDDTAEGSARSAIAQLADERVTYIKREVPSQGRPSLVRNEGMRRAEAPLLHFLDDDDELCDDALASLMDPLQKSHVGMSFGIVDPRGEDDAAVANERRYFHRAAESARRCGASRSRLAKEILFGTVPFVTSSCLIRRDVARELGGFDEHMALCEDFEFFLRASRGYGAAFVDRAVLRRRTGLPSLSREANARQWRDAYARIHRRYRSRFGIGEFYALKAWATVERLTRKS
jgi:GT2 family glycosyltransferase